MGSGVGCGVGSGVGGGVGSGVGGGVGARVGAAVGRAVGRGVGCGVAAGGAVGAAVGGVTPGAVGPFPPGLVGAAPPVGVVPAPEVVPSELPPEVTVPGAGPLAPGALGLVPALGLAIGAPDATAPATSPPVSADGDAETARGAPGPDARGTVAARTLATTNAITSPKPMPTAVCRYSGSMRPPTRIRSIHPKRRAGVVRLIRLLLTGVQHSP